VYIQNLPCALQFNMFKEETYTQCTMYCRWAKQPVSPIFTIHHDNSKLHPVIFTNLLIFFFHIQWRQCVVRIHQTAALKMCGMIKLISLVQCQWCHHTCKVNFQKRSWTPHSSRHVTSCLTVRDHLKFMFINHQHTGQPATSTNWIHSVNSS
jgi:hypothetical protein